MSRRAATTTTSICGVDALLGGDAADHLVVEHRLVERHRDLLLGLEADRGLELLRVLDRRQPQGADDDALVGDPEAHPLGELVRAKSDLSAAASASGSATSPSWKAPGASGAIAVRRDLRRAVAPAPRPRRCCRPRCRGRRRARLLLVSCMLVRDTQRARRPPSIDRKADRPFALQLLSSRRTLDGLY